MATRINWTLHNFKLGEPRRAYYRFAWDGSPAYVAVAIQRWVDVTGGEPVLLEG
ncbi:MAG: hypothetical protein GX625_16250 [Clostridiaceae bacterium]|nr:hypothetical protein [Clostridiaceae bacterium]